MKTIGLLGGMSWESTALYYQWINEFVKRELGGLHSAQIVMISVDFQVIEDLQQKNMWEEAGRRLSESALQVEKAGADFLLICTNTMHKVALQVENTIDIPLLHIADATADEIKKQGMTTIGLLGTAFTMEQEFYAGRLKENHGLNVLIPKKEDRIIIHRVIYDELVLGIQREESREEYLRIMKDLLDRGAEGVIEGCTEIVMLVNQEHTTIPLFDTTALHAKKAVDLALMEDKEHDENQISPIL